MNHLPCKALLIMAFVWPLFGTVVVLAQAPTSITPTVGTGDLGTTVTAQGHTIQITGGSRPSNGVNLFHSFEQFNVGSPDTAQFLNTTPSLLTSNILSRVTGGNPSNIFGTIDTISYPSANLFLLNPAGIIFGPNATLNVGGSVAFTTADYLRFANTEGSNVGIFRADPTAANLLTSAPVSAFGFLNPNAAAMVTQGSTLMVQSNQSISFVGGNITIQSAHLLAPGGQLIVVSVGSPGEIQSETLNQTSNIHGESSGTLGTIQVLQQSSIDTSGEGGGAIRIRGGSLTVDDSRISANSTQSVISGTGPHLDPAQLGIGIEVTQDTIIKNGAIVETNVAPGAPLGSGEIRITADRIEISGGPKVTDPFGFLFGGIRSNIASGTTAPSSGNILLNATSIRLKDNGQIQTQTAGEGSAGNITLNASGNISIETAIVSSGAATSSGKAGNIALTSTQGNMSITNSLVTAQQFFEKRNNVNVIVESGNAGDITIHALNGDIALDARSRISNASLGTTGKLGRIEIRANNLILDQSSSIEGVNLTTESPENILITLTGRLELSGGSFIRTGANGPANAAELNINASHILITGRDPSSGQPSELTTSTISSGNAGALRLFTDTLELTNGGRLSSESLTRDIGEYPSGSGGIIEIASRNSVKIDGGGSGIFTNTEGAGPAGIVALNTKTLSLENNGTISAATSGTSVSATGGAVIINAMDQVAMTNNASITARSTGPAEAGKIDINAGRQLDLINGSSITTTTQSAQANGGNIDVRAIDRIRLVNSTISTSVLGAEGNGGNIFIDPKVVVLEESTVTAKAVGGSGGNITFVTPLFLKDSASDVNASSQRGASGTVTIQSPTSNLSGTVGQLASKTNPPQVLLQNRCIALAGGGGQSTFILSGRDALPSEPGGWLSSPVAVEHWIQENTEDHASGLMVKNTKPNPSPALMASKNESRVLSLRRLTPPGFLVRTFATPSTGCPS